MANQTRIVLDAGDRPKAEQILESTGIKTFSQLFAIFLVNYGDHLVKALKASPSAPPVIIPASARELPTIAKPQRDVLLRHTPMDI